MTATSQLIFCGPIDTPLYHMETRFGHFLYFLQKIITSSSETEIKISSKDFAIKLFDPPEDDRFQGKPRVDNYGNPLLALGGPNGEVIVGAHLVLQNFEKFLSNLRIFKETIYNIFQEAMTHAQDQHRKVFDALIGKINVVPENTLKISCDQEGNFGIDKEGLEKLKDDLHNLFELRTKVFAQLPIKDLSPNSMSVVDIDNFVNQVSSDNLEETKRFKVEGDGYRTPKKLIFPEQENDTQNFLKTMIRVFSQIGELEIFFQDLLDKVKETINQTTPSKNDLENLGILEALKTVLKPKTSIGCKFY